MATDSSVRSQTDARKVRAVKECKPPGSRDGVRNFLGMIGLTGRDVPCTWGTEEDAALQKLKDSITNDDTMAFFSIRESRSL